MVGSSRSTFRQSPQGTDNKGEVAAQPLAAADPPPRRRAAELGR